MLDRRAPHRAQAADHHIEMSHTVGPAIRFSNSSEGGCAFATAKELPPQIKSGAAFAGTAVPWLFAGISRAMPIGRYKVAILADIATVKPLRALIILAAVCAFAPCDFAVARVVPLPRPRPAEIPPVLPTQEATPEEAPAPSACRLRLTAELAIAPSLPALAGPGECVEDDVVRLEAVRLADKTQVAVTPPAILRCSFAEAIVHWVREDVVPRPQPDHWSEALRAWQGQRARHPLLQARQRHSRRADRPDCGQGFSRALAKRYLRSFQHRARPWFRRLSREPRPCGSRRARGRPPHVPVGGPRARR